MSRFEDGVQAALRSRAAQVDVPVPDLEALLDEAHRADVERRRRGRRWVVGLAAASVLAVLGGVAVQGEPDRPRDEQPVREDDAEPPRQVSDLPEGSPPRLPYVLGPWLYSDGARRPARGVHGLTYGGTGVSLGLQDSGVVRVDGPADVVLDAEAQGWPVISPGGRFAAWQTTAPGDHPVVVLYSVDEGRVLDEATFPVTPECCDAPFGLAGIDDSGRVFSREPLQRHVWDTRSGAVRPLRGIEPSDQLVAVLPDRVVLLRSVSDTLDEVVYVVGSVSEDGTFVVERTVVADTPAVWWSPDGTQYVVGRTDAPPTVRGMDEETAVEVAIPQDTEVVEVAWESTEDLLVLVETLTGVELTTMSWDWLRCSAVDGRCERALEISDDLVAEVAVGLPER